MSEYTPTTDSVEWDYATRMAPARDDARRTRFRAWLNKIKAEAWEQGYDAALMGGRPRRQNPYREEF